MNVYSADYHFFLVSDHLFYEMMTSNRKEIIESLHNDEYLEFEASTMTHPSVLRTAFTYALLEEKDTEKADHLLTLFNEVAQTWPYPSFIQGERELIALAKSKAE
jgi:hypothetical protein